MQLNTVKYKDGDIKTIDVEIIRFALLKAVKLNSYVVLGNTINYVTIISTTQQHPVYIIEWSDYYCIKNHIAQNYKTDG